MTYQADLRSFVNHVRKIWGCALSAIVLDPVTVQWSDTRDVCSALDSVARQSRRYHWQKISGHYILYPDEPVWSTRISGVLIHKVPRIDATGQYLAMVRAQAPTLSDLDGPSLKGDPRSPVYCSPISLSADARIMDHLAQLLGEDEEMIFTIEPDRSGQRLLHFERVVLPEIRNIGSESR